MESEAVLIYNKSPAIWGLRAPDIGPDIVRHGIRGCPC